MAARAIVSSHSVANALELARARLLAGEFALARMLCEKVLAVEGGNARALHMLGVAAFETNDVPGAIEMLERAIAADPGAIDSYDYLQMVLGDAGQPAQARQVADLGAKARAFKLRFGHLPAPLRNYQRLVNGLRESRYMDFPREVAIETLAMCNAACAFCPYPSLERKGEKMPDALISKIIADLQDIPAGLPFIVSPFKVSDPLLDVRIFDILEECSARLPDASLRLFTNGSPLTERHLARISRIPRVEHLWISLNHHEEKRYQEIMQLPWRRTKEKLDMLHRHKASGSFSPPVLLSRVGDGGPDDAAFLRFAAAEFPLFQTALVAQSGWLGQVSKPQTVADVYPVGCGRWYELSITATGKVAFCCMDGQAEHPIGDAAATHLLEIYNSMSYRKYREQFATRLDGFPCRGCTNL